MFKSVLAVMAIVLMLPTTVQAGEAAPTSSYQLTGGGGYYAIVGCFRSWSAAQRRARRIGGISFNTNHYPNFRSGYKCAGYGPSSRGRARAQCSSVREDGYRCYVKNAYRH